MDKIRSEIWDAIYHVISNARPHHLEVECIEEFITNIGSPFFDGDYMKAADEALWEWDV